MNGNIGSLTPVLSARPQCLNQLHHCLPHISLYCIKQIANIHLAYVRPVGVPLLYANRLPDRRWGCWSLIVLWRRSNYTAISNAHWTFRLCCWQQEHWPLKYKIQKGSVPSQIVLNNNNAVVYWNNEIVTKETNIDIKRERKQTLSNWRQTLQWLLKKNKLKRSNKIRKMEGF